VFRGGWSEGDKVQVPELKVFGTVVDADPVSLEIDRSETVAIRVDSVPPGGTLYVGATFYAEPEYVSAVPKAQPGIAALGGQGGAGGQAIGSATVVQGVSARLVPLPADAAKVLNTDSAVVKPKYIDVTAESNWTNLQVGDIVTAEHKSRPASYARGSSADVVTSRTSEVVRGDGWGGPFWCELELSRTNRYDPYKITKVLRLKRSRLLSERRRPIQLTVTRLVAPTDIWGPTYIKASAAGYVEKRTDGHYWLVFTDGDRAGKQIRLKVGRDTVTYEAVLGTYHARDSFEELVVATHDPE
jgi:hypothetical protein